MSVHTWGQSPSVHRGLLPVQSSQNMARAHLGTVPKCARVRFSVSAKFVAQQLLPASL